MKTTCRYKPQYGGRYVIANDAGEVMTFFERP